MGIDLSPPHAPGDPLPSYRSHKRVWALKIAEVKRHPDGTGTIIPADRSHGPFGVSAEYLFRNDPRAGGYWVMYEDGWQGWYSAGAFEQWYTLAEDDGPCDPPPGDDPYPDDPEAAGVVR